MKPASSGLHGANLKVPFGLKDGRLYLPQNTTRGLACECKCPACGSALVSNQGQYKRPYFSHHQSEDCANGYETALHLMAKQLIEEHGYIMSPHFRHVLSETLSNDDEVTEEIFIEGQRLEFAEVRLEKTVEGLRPDVLGVTDDGTEFLIEIFVTHSVETEKQRRLSGKNLIEIDLSWCSQELVSNEIAFAEEVLFRGDRRWIACQLYSEELEHAQVRLDEKVKQAKIDLQAELEAAQREQLLRREREKRRAEIEATKSRLREGYREQLEKLNAYVDSPQSYAPQLGINTREAIIREIGCDTLPGFLSHELKGDWIFKAHRSVWQSFIFNRFINGKPKNKFHAGSVKDAVVAEFGVLDWVGQLISLKREHKAQGRIRGQWYADSGAWFLTDLENKMIPENQGPREEER